MKTRIALLFFAVPLFAAVAPTLVVYAIDTEGGKATLYISPSGATMLVDAGYGGNDGRDAARIEAVMRDAGVKRIDYLVATHYHADHIGGVAALAARVPVGTFVDRGGPYSGREKAEYESYAQARKDHTHTIVQAGDRLPVPGIAVDVVAAGGKGITNALHGAGLPNPACATYQPLEPDPGEENALSIGVIVEFGRFRVVDLGDLYWNQEYDLVCPENKLGTVDVYMTTHHGTQTSGSPQIVWAIHPRVAVMNNGPHKGGSLTAWQTIHSSPGLIDLWQLHFSPERGRAQNPPPKFIANSAEPCHGDWIRISARADGSFTIFNSRNRFSRTYPPETKH